MNRSKHLNISGFCLAVRIATKEKGMTINELFKGLYAGSSRKIEKRLADGIWMPRSKTFIYMASLLGWDRKETVVRLDHLIPLGANNRRIRTLKLMYDRYIREVKGWFDE